MYIPQKQGANKANQLYERLMKITMRAFFSGITINQTLYNLLLHCVYIFQHDTIYVLKIQTLYGYVLLPFLK